MPRRLHMHSCLPTLLLWVGWAVLCLVLAGCDRRGDSTGADWEPPADSAMPAAFAQAEDVPEYARHWHMPPGFRGFVARWNSRVTDYLDNAIREQQNNIAEAQQQLRSAGHLNKDDEGARARYRLAANELAQLTARRQLGPQLVLLTDKDLPTDLHWQKGDREPEIGDPAARKGGTIRLALLRSFPNTLRVFGPNSNNASRRFIYDDIDLPLVRIHPGTGAFIPGTADRWAISPDGRTVYFHIDPKAQFSNGDPLTTRDFIASIFIRTSPYSAEPFYTDFYLANFARIAVYSDRIIAVTLPTPKPYAEFYAAALPSACTRFYAEFGPDYPTRYLWRAAPTTGGYAVDPEGIIMGRQLMLTRVPNWWAAKRKYTRYSCNVDHIVYSFIAEASKLRELFRIGELDVISTRDADLWYEGLEIEPVHRGYIQRVHFDNLWPRNCFGFHLNCSLAPFNDLNVRKGFHHALNIQAVINTLFRGDYKRGGSYFSGFGPFTNPAIQALPFDPDRARAYFAAAGFTVEGQDGILQREDGTRLQVVVSSRIDTSYAAAMNILREDAARCGLDLRFDQMDDTVFYLKVKNKQYSACIFSWGFSPPLPDASQFFLSQYAYNADGSPKRGTSNITATASPELDRAILAARSATTKDEAIAAQHHVQQCIADTASWVPGWSSWFWRFAQWRWVRWPNTPHTRFCPPRYYDPLDSHLYWIDEQVKRETLRARSAGETFPEVEISIPLPSSAP